MALIFITAENSLKSDRMTAQYAEVSILSILTVYTFTKCPAIYDKPGRCNN